MAAFEFNPTNIQNFQPYSANVTYTLGSIVRGSDNHLYRCLTSNIGNDPTTVTDNTNWELFLATSNLTINVTSRFSTLYTAYNFVKNAQEYTGASVTIQVADGTYNMATSLSICTPLGSNLSILGNISTPTNCVLNFNANTNGIAVGAQSSNPGFSLGNLNGFKINGTWTNGVSGIGLTAVSAWAGSTIICGTSMITSGFYYGFQAAQNSTIYCPSAKVYLAGDAGFFSYQNSFISAIGSLASGCQDTGNSLGSGYCSEQNSHIDATSSIAVANRYAGFNCINGTMRVYSCSSSGNSGYGFRVRAGGNMEAGGAMLANSNTNDGVLVSEGSAFNNYVGSTLTTKSNGGNGVYFDYASHGFIQSLTSLSNTGAGAKIWNGSRVILSGATLGTTGSANSYGLDIFGLSYVSFNGGGSCKNNTNNGIVAQDGSFVYAVGTIITGNVGGATSPALDTLGNRNAFIRST